MSQVTEQGDKEDSHQSYEAITYQDIAAKLLKDNFLLTALELHTQLYEGGKELKQLKDFFSNPKNFEISTMETSQISRSESQVTLDSLDLTRFSEDGAGPDDKVAVLEFELRKAKETINALRNNLTVATESGTSTPDKNSLRFICNGSIKPHEQRALNFLINEYLLLNSYKLTSITFADENQHQDFDDWDDVGLNIAKPPELLTLYRDFFQKSNLTTASVGLQIIEEDINFNSKNNNIFESENLKKLQHDYKCLQAENMEYKNLNMNLAKENEFLLNRISENIPDIQSKDSSYSKGSVHSESGIDKFEIIENNAFFDKRDSNVDVEDNVSNMSYGNDWTNLPLYVDSSYAEKNNLDNFKKVNRSSDAKRPSVLDVSIGENFFEKEVFSMCYINIPQRVSNEVLDNILNYPVNKDTLISILTNSLLKIIPNIILNKREDAIPLIVSAVDLNENVGDRDKLLQLLFNLKKKPSETERTLILTGIVAIAKFSGEALVENEILPQCWEQLTDKHVEKRLLVVEACIALTPYVSSQIRNSLILSMLQHLLSDREEIVRETTVKALSLLVVMCTDSDKYFQCEELALTTLNDSCTNVISLSIELLFPVLGRWSLTSGYLKTHLFKHLLQNLNCLLKETAEVSVVMNKILAIVDVLDSLIPFLLMSVTTHESVLDNVDGNMAIEMRSDIIKLCSTLTNPSNFFAFEYNVGMVLYEFDKYILHNKHTSWPEMDWVLDIMIPDLLNTLNHIDTMHQVLLERIINVFSHMCVFFGENFTKYKIYPILHQQVNSLKQILLNFNQFYPSLNVIPVYLISVLSYCDTTQLSIELKEFLCVIPLCGCPLDCLDITVKGLCLKNFQEIVVVSLWDTLVHQRPLVRTVAANLFSTVIGNSDKNLLISKVTPALITLANDTDVLVKTATLSSLGTLITDCDVPEIHDKVYMQIQNYIADSTLNENHSFVRQLIVTLGNVVDSCSIIFKQEVLLPHLSFVASNLSKMVNQTRKIDLAHALLEAFTAIVYSVFSKKEIKCIILPGLKCLENVINENQSLNCYRETIESMIRECEETSSNSSGYSATDYVKLTHNVNQGVEEMKMKVSKIFSKTGTKPSSIQNMFKKK